MNRFDPPARAPVLAVRALAPIAAFALAGCASFSPDGGFGQASELTKARTGQAIAWQRDAAATDQAQARVRQLLAEPLVAESAVEIALLNNRGLQARFAELGIAEADRVRAGRLANPTIGFGRLSGGGVTEIDRSVMFGVLGLLTMPVEKEFQQRRFEQAQVQAALDATTLATDTRTAFFAAVAAQELLAYREQVKATADAADELAQRMQQAGNFSPLARMRQQAFQADATAQLARGRHQALAERERLVRLLGLPDASSVRLPERLPALPAAPVAPAEAEQVAMDQRLDLRLARRANEAMARSLGLTRATRFVNVLEAGYANSSHSGEPRRNGYEVMLELPLFDFGSTQVARAEALYRQSMDRTAELAVNARSEVRESHSAYRSAYELARHYRDEVVPLKKRISEENLRRYNGMLIGVFELLADSREQITGVTDAIEALRDHWIAEAQLQAALTARMPNAATAPTRSGPTAAADAGH